MVPSGQLCKRPLPLRISTALMDAVDSQSLHHQGPCCRTHWVALQEIPVAFATVETNGQDSCGRLPADFTTEGPKGFCICRLQLSEPLPAPPARATPASSATDAVESTAAACPSLCGYPPRPCTCLQLVPTAA